MIVCSEMTKSTYSRSLSLQPYATSACNQLSAVIYNFAINLARVLLIFMGIFFPPVGAKLHQPRNSNYHYTLSSFYSPGRMRKEKLYILISWNVFLHCFYTEELNHCQVAHPLACTAYGATSKNTQSLLRINSFNAAENLSSVSCRQGHCGLGENFTLPDTRSQ